MNFFILQAVCVLIHSLKVFLASAPHFVGRDLVGEDIRDGE